MPESWGRRDADRERMNWELVDFADEDFRVGK